MKKTDNTNTGLRCRPGDRAVIVRPPIPAMERLVGAYLECENVCGAISFLLRGPVWHIKPLSPVLVEMDIGHMPDDCLRPLRDDEGQDKTLEWVDVPSTDKVPA